MHVSPQSAVFQYSSAKRAALRNRESQSHSMLLCPWDVGSVASYRFAAQRAPGRWRPAHSDDGNDNVNGNGNGNDDLTERSRSGSSGTNSCDGEACDGEACDGEQQVSATPTPAPTPKRVAQTQTVSVYLSHRHNITIAINDEPIDKIQMKCRSPSCYQHAQSRFYIPATCASPSSTYKLNVCVLCVSYVALYSSFRALQNLYTTLYSPHLGAAAMCCAYAAACASSVLVLPAVHAAGTKRSMLFAFSCCMLWMAASFYPRWYTLLPASLLLGVGHSVCWNAQIVYMAAITEIYKSSVKAPMDVLKYNALLLALFQTSHVWGNAITSLIFKYFRPALPDGLLLANSSHWPLNTTALNSSATLFYASDGKCAMLDCAGTLLRPGQSTALSLAEHRYDAISLVVVALLVLSGLGFLAICLFLQNINTEHRRVRFRDSTAIAKSSFRQMSDPVFRMLIPLLVVSGFEQGLIYADYNKWFIACSFGIDSVGLHMMILGMMNVLGSAIVGFSARHCAREIIIAINSLVHIALLIVLIMCVPFQYGWIMFLVSACWGLCDAAWQTQCNLLIATECGFGDYRLAFANFRFLQSFGTLLAFALSTVLCNYLKLYLLLGMLVFSITCYSVLEYRIRRRNGDGQREEAVAAEVIELKSSANSNNNSG